MFKILGITDDRTDCECCGKSRLKCTVALEREAGNIVYYGRHCAALAVHGNKSARNVSRIEQAALQAMQTAAQNRRDKLNRVADGDYPLGIGCPKQEANYRYSRTGRNVTGSYFASRGLQIVRVDGSDIADVEFYTSEGFVRFGVVAGPM